jgi:hypothetical protein
MRLFYHGRRKAGSVQIPAPQPHQDPKIGSEL